MEQDLSVVGKKYFGQNRKKLSFTILQNSLVCSETEKENYEILFTNLFLINVRAAIILQNKNYVKRGSLLFSALVRCIHKQKCDDSEKESNVLLRRTYYNNPIFSVSMKY